jgi:quinol monooxygenase YgiN
MSAKPVRVLVSFRFPDAGKARSFAELFRDSFIPRTRLEDGCLLYDVWIANDNPCLVSLVESWASQEQLDAHLAQDWLKALLAPAMALLGEGNAPDFHFCTSVMD